MRAFTPAEIDDLAAEVRSEAASNALQEAEAAELWWFSSEREEQKYWDDVDRDIARAQEALFWPEDFPKQYDESQAQASLRRQVLDIVRNWYHERH